RIQNGLPPLDVSPLLTEAAQEKADDMAQNSYYAHVSPDGKTPLYWLDHVGYHYLNAGENLVIDRTSSQQAVDAWMNSPDHRENILRPQFTEIGIGVAKGTYDGLSTIFVVQEFGTPYPTARAIAIAPKPAPVKIAPVEQSTPAVKPVTTSKPTETPAPTQTPAVPPVTPNVPTIPTVPNIPKVTPHIVATLATPKSETAVAATTTSATTTPAEQGSSTVNYTLAPEFYKPVTLSARESAANEIQPAAPQASSVSALSVLLSEIKAFLGHIFNTAA
ncbi:MAG TPA: CAP domain-containing protein, partial [Candidatus Paceibacterota bacterium]|nr:CAP domain-containing protein [Candidatus Paceibacterota bacterium]